MKKRFLFLALIIASSSVYADFSDWFSGLSSLPSHAVSDASVASSSCLIGDMRDKESRNLKFKQFFQSLDSGKKKKSIILQGKTFINASPDYLSLYYSLTGIKQYRLNDDCDSIQCEVESLLGATYMHKLVYLIKNFGYNASYLAQKDGKAFSESELDIIIWSFEQLPAFMFNQNIKMLKKDMNNYVDGVFAGVVGQMERSGDMTLFKRWSSKTDAMKFYTIIHEYGHYMGSSLFIDESMDWLSLSNWTKVPNGTKNKAKNMISQYSRGNHIEDFAEAFSAYRLNAHYLKEKAPKKYELIKSIAFLGTEYTTRDCGNHNLEVALNDKNINIESISKTCEFPILGYRLGLKEVYGVFNCLNINESQITLLDFNPVGVSYQERIKENFLNRNYPFIPKEKLDTLKTDLVDSLEMIKR